VQLGEVFLGSCSKTLLKRETSAINRSSGDLLLKLRAKRALFGRRDHAFILTAVQTGLRLSEITATTREDLALGTSAHVRVIDKGRKERCTSRAKRPNPPPRY
jgi:site-specific recombinase XerC